VLLLYARTIGFPYTNWDDTQYLTGNPYLRGWSFEHLRHLFSLHGLPHEELYIPLTYLSHLVTGTLAGGQPWGDHLGNVLLHLANTLLAFALLRRLSVRPWPAAGAVALFALHPVAVEAVAWCMGRKDLLATCFSLLTGHAFLSWRAAPRPRRAALLALAFGAALLAKPTVAPLPVVLLLLDSLAERRLRRAALLALLPLLALAAGAFLLHRYLAVPAPPQATGGLAIAQTLWTVREWTWRLLLAQPVIPYYPRPTAGPAALLFASLPVLLGWLAVAGLLLWRRLRWPLATVAGAALFALPTLTVVWSSRSFTTGDRYLYLPLLLLAAAAVPLLARLTHPRYLCALLLFFAGFTWRGTSHWRDSEPLWRAVLARYPQAVAARNNLANTLAARGDDMGAVEHYRWAMRLEPDGWQTLVNLGESLARLGQREEAIACHSRALELNPGYATAHHNLGVALADGGDLDGALAALTAATRLAPHRAESWSYLGIVLARREQRPEAIAAFRRAAQLAPRDTAILNNLACALGDAGQLREAANLFRAILAQKPDDASAKENLAVTLKLLGEP